MSQMTSKSLCNYFDEDLVYRISRGGTLKVGAVVECTENDDSDSDEEEIHMGSKLPPGHVKVAWYPEGKSQVVSEKKVMNKITYRIEIVAFFFCR